MKSVEEIVKNAIKLRKITGFRKYFIKPDYIGSAMLFEEAASISDNKEKYLLEAADTYEMDESEYGYFKAATIYNEMAEEYKKIEYFKISGTLYEKAGNFASAGNTYKKGFFYEDALFAYKKQKGYKRHVEEVINEIVLDNIRQNNYDKAYEYSEDDFSKELLSILTNKEGSLDCNLSNEQNKLVEILYNGTEEIKLKSLINYRKNNALNKIQECLFNSLINKLQDDDIC